MERAAHRGGAILPALAALCAALALFTASTLMGAQAANALAPPQTGSQAASASATPLPESDYGTHSACSAPAPGYAGCLALELIPHTSAAKAHTHPLGMIRSRPIANVSAAEGSFGLRPQDLRDAYFPAAGELPEAPASAPQTIALVDAYNDPSARTDLEAYEREFALKSCPAASSSCFEQLNQNGGTALPFPESEAARRAELAVCENRHKSLAEREAACANVEEAEGWDVEISTDIEVARGVCQNCKIVLLEASVPSYFDLETAEETAVELGATEISNSWGGAQEGSSGHAFDHAGTVITAAAGDDGYLNWTEAEAAEKAKQEKEATGYFVGADYPAASPDVVAVGGTKLTLSGGARQSETVWNEDPSPEDTNAGAGGGGCSESFPAQLWQQAVPDWSQVDCGSKRAVADVSADADPYTGVAVYDSVPTVHEEADGKVVNTPLEWWPIGGTSVASPIVASMFALAGGAHGVEYPAQTLYSHLGSPLLHDVTAGGNGACDDNYTSCTGSIDPLSPLDCGQGVWICNATTGYDGPTGVGTPAGIGAFEPSEEGAKKGNPSEEPSKSGKGGAEGGTGKEGTGGETGGSKEGTGSEPGSGKETSSGKEGAGGKETGSKGSSGESTTGKEGTGLLGETLGGGKSSAASLVGGTPGVGSTGTAQSASGAAKPVAAPRISGLMLTANAQAALRRLGSTVARLAFSCRLSQATRVRVTLSERVRVDAHTRWRSVSPPFAFAAVKGLNRRRLHGTSALASGVYRLTLTPAGGSARSLTIRVS